MKGLHTDLGIVLRGLGVSSGIALGVACRFDRAEVHFERVHLPDGLLDAEVSRLMEAVAKAEEAVDDLNAQLEADGVPDGEHLGILEAHKLMLRDQALLMEMEQHIRQEKVNAEWALAMTLDHFREIFARMDDPFFRERGADVQHVGELLLRALLDEDEGGLDPFESTPPDAIIVARHLSPSEMLRLIRQGLRGLVLEEGSATSHTSIIARSLDIPTVVSVKEISELVGQNDRMIIDADEGEVIVRPTPEKEMLYERRLRRARAFMKALKQNRNKPAETSDGHTITLRGNLDLVEDRQRITDFGGDGIGLFRTEFLFIDRGSIPSEAEQLETYVKVLQGMSPHPVTIRTLDVGGDKLLPQGVSERQISTGLRAIRFCLMHKNIFRTQLRALFRASAHGPVRLLVPFVSDMDEVLAVKNMMRGVRKELEQDGVPMADDIPLGFMIEVPAAALIAHQIAKEADFLSVGTNDLIQYTLAISRDDPSLDYLYYPLHPAMIRLFQMVCRAARAHDIPVAMCGEMASEPRYTLILAALGFTELSMNAGSIPMVKEVVRRSRMKDGAALLDQVLELSSAVEITDLVESFMIEHYPDIVMPRLRAAPDYVR